MLKTLQVEIIHPQAERILKELAAVELIRIEKNESLRTRLDRLMRNVKQHQKKHGEPEPLSMEEVTMEVKKVRTERYAKRNKT
jgi:Holliday junction resolvasome RuvABC endonuclease subunit